MTLIKLKITLFIASAALLNGCVAATVVSGEYIASGLAVEYSKSGVSLQKLGKWEEAVEKTTYSTYGKESWICADVFDTELKKNEDFKFVCIDSTVVLKDNIEKKFICTEGKGGMISVVNKNSTASIYCKILNNDKNQTVSDKNTSFTNKDASYENATSSKVTPKLKTSVPKKKLTTTSKSKVSK